TALGRRFRLECSQIRSRAIEGKAGDDQTLVDCRALRLETKVIVHVTDKEWVDPYEVMVGGGMAADLCIVRTAVIPYDVVPNHVAGTTLHIDSCSTRRSRIVIIRHRVVIELHIVCTTAMTDSNTASYIAIALPSAVDHVMINKGILHIRNHHGILTEERPI